MTHTHKLSLLLCFILTTICFSCSCEKNDNKYPINVNSLGVWWWDTSILDSTIYLDFITNNGVKEIYLSDNRFNDETSKFITKCKSNNINVYFLAGEYSWLNNSSPLFALIDRYRVYQTSFPDSQFSGIHLDIEPHQDPDFKLLRQQLLQQYSDLVVDLSVINDISIDYVIPFWFNDSVTDKSNQSIKELYKVVFDHSDRVFIMSYRDNAAEIFRIAKDECEYAQKVGKKIFFGALASFSKEGNKVSFFEEGKQYMYDELNKLHDYTHSDYGIAIHHIKTWMDLKE